MKLARGILGVACASLASAGFAADYVGTLRPPSSALGLFSTLHSFSTILAPASAPDSGFGLKLGYAYSRYLSVEGEVNDAGRAASDLFTPALPGAAFRASGFGVDTVATLPLWRFSFYGRLGAYHGEPRNQFMPYSVSLLTDAATHTRLRYGLGVRYDFTNALGVRAEVERYTPLGTPLAGDPEGDLFSVGVSWRF